MESAEEKNAAKTVTLETDKIPAIYVLSEAKPGS